MNRTSQRGFTIIELMIATTIFSLIVISISALFAQALTIQRRARAVRRVTENAQFVIESVSREVRVSKVVSLDTSCNPPGVPSQSLVIEHPINGAITYQYDPVRRVVTRQQSGFSAQDITTTDVSFTQFAFCIAGSGVGGAQVRITMPMTIVAVGLGILAPTGLSLQTTVSGRDLVDDLPL